MIADEALAALSDALADALEAGRVPPCAGDERFTDKRENVRASVANRCDGCPVRAECRRAGEHETHGVWGGVDVTVKAPPRPKNPRNNEHRKEP